MAEKADKADKAEKDFTPRELEIMAHAWNCMVEEPKVRLLFPIHTNPV